MSGRLLSAGVAVVLLVGLATLITGAVLPACYDVPRPDCGFLCGPGDACPDGYACAADRTCHRSGAPADLTCVTPDALLPVDAATIDAAVDATSAPP